MLPYTLHMRIMAFVSVVKLTALKNILLHTQVTTLTCLFHLLLTPSHQIFLGHPLYHLVLYALDKLLLQSGNLPDDKLPASYCSAYNVPQR